MSTLKFRGKVDGRWWYAEYNPDEAFGNWEQFWAICDPSTVGQYIRDDENDHAIYEDDIIRHEPHWEDGHTITHVKSIHQFCGDDGIYHGIEVIGNLHDNPELLQKAGEA